MDLFPIYAGLKLITAPTAEPLDLIAAQNYLRISSDNGGPNDQDVTAFITFARQQCEAVLKRALLLQTWQLSLKNWPGRDYQNWPQGDYSGCYKYDHIPLPNPPLKTVRSVTYLDTDANPTVMPAGNVAGGYNVDLNFEPGRIVLPFSQIWPTTILLPGAPIQIVYDCGYDDVPTLASQFEGYAAVVHAMKMIISYVYENKIPPSEMRRSSIDAGIQFVVEQMLTPYRIY